MRRVVMLLMASALMVMIGAAPASAQVIIEPGLVVSKGGVVAVPSKVCNTLAGIVVVSPNNPFPPTSAAPLPSNPFPPTRDDGEVCWLELPGWDAAAAQLAAASSSTVFPTGAIPLPNNPFPPT